jgi:hypothetical protein
LTVAYEHDAAVHAVRCWKAGNQVTRGLRSPSPGVVEVARKRAVLATQVVFHYSRFRIALWKSADHERRQGRTDCAMELEALRIFFDGYSSRFADDADEAHARWEYLRGASRTRAE